MVLWRPTRPSRTNTPKRCPFHFRGLECKSRKSRNTWSNRQIWPWRTEWNRAKANRVLPREHTGHNLQRNHKKVFQRRCITFLSYQQWKRSSFSINICRFFLSFFLSLTAVLCEVICLCSLICISLMINRASLVVQLVKNPAGND